MPPDPCPTEPDLLAFHLGRLPEDTLVVLEDHLAGCSCCEAALSRLEGADDDVTAALRRPAGTGADTLPAAEAPDDPGRPFVPGYEILGELGRGGMGVVYKARQLNLDRVVALKVALGGWLAGRDERARFRREAEAIARLHHPGIVQIHEVGEYAGLPYFSLEWIEGGSLDARLAGRPQPPDAAAELVEQLARAVHYAHEHGVVHRDLKPANVLLSVVRGPWSVVKTDAMPDGGAAPGFDNGLRTTDYGQPKITDFGLAKLLDAASALTRTGVVAGTPQYMAPEQATTAAGRIGPATDVYALGVILYEMLTGRPPFQAATPAELLLQVVGVEPVSVSRLRPGAPRDLAVICQHCLEKEPVRRYPSAQALADDLARFRRGEPILARPVGEVERLWKWAKRRPTVAGLLAAVAASLLVGTAVSTYFAVEADRRAHDAQEHERTAVAERNHSRRQLADDDFQRGRDLAEAGRGAEGLHWMAAALRELPDEPEDGPVRAAVRTNLAAWGERLHRLRFQHRFPDYVFALALSPDGRRFAASAGLAGAIQVYDADRGTPLGPPLEHGHCVRALAFSPDGRTLVSGGDGAGPNGEKRPPRVRRWDVAAGRELPGSEAPAPKVIAVAFRPDGRHFLTADRWAGTVQEWETATGRPVDTWTAGGRIEDLILSPDGRTVVAVVQNRPNLAIVLRDGDGPPRRVELGAADRATLHPDGRTLWVSQQAGTVRRWDLAAGRYMGEALRHPAGALLAFSPDGQTVAVGSTERQEEVRPLALTLRRAATGQFLGSLGLDELYQVLAIGPDGRRLLSAGDRTVRLWDLADPVPLAERLAARPVPEFAHVVYSRDRTLWAAATVAGGFARLGLVGSGRGLRDFAQAAEVHSYRAGQVALSPDGSRVATIQTERPWQVQVWDAATGRPVGQPTRSTDVVSTLAFSPDGRMLAIGDYDQNVFLLDAATGASLGPPLIVPDIVASLAFSPDGRRLAVGVYRDKHRQCSATLWDLSARQPLGPPLRTDHPPEVLFSPDGRTLVTFADGGAQCWDVARGVPRGPFLPHQSGRVAVAFSPDGRGLATGDSGGIVRLWDAADLRPLPGAAFPHPAGVTQLAFSPDGRRLAVVTRDRAARVWDIAGGKPLGPPAAGRAPVLGVLFTPDGSGLIVTTGDGRTRVWPVPAERDFDAERLDLELRVATGLRPDVGQSLVPADEAVWRQDRDCLLAVGGPPALPSPPDIGLERDEARLRDAEQDGDAFAGLWHLDRLVVLRPDDWLLHARRGRLDATAGRWESAVAAYDRAERVAPPGGLSDWYRMCADDCRAAGRLDIARHYLDRLARPPGASSSCRVGAAAGGVRRNGGSPRSEGGPAERGDPLVTVVRGRQHRRRVAGGP